MPASGVADYLRYVYPAGSVDGDTTGELVGAGDEVGIVCSIDGEFTFTSFHGRRGSTQGKITKNSKARTPTSNARQPVSLPAKPPGILRHNHSYMASPPQVLAASQPT